jgi:hypothetical protein
VLGHAWRSCGAAGHRRIVALLVTELLLELGRHGRSPRVRDLDITVEATV